VVGAEQAVDRAVEAEQAPNLVVGRVALSQVAQPPNQAAQALEVAAMLM